MEKQEKDGGVTVDYFIELHKSVRKINCNKNWIAGGKFRLKKFNRDHRLERLDALAFTDQSGCRYIVFGTELGNAVLFETEPKIENNSNSKIEIVYENDKTITARLSRYIAEIRNRRLSEIYSLVQTFERNFILSFED